MVMRRGTSLVSGHICIRKRWAPSRGDAEALRIEKQCFLSGAASASVQRLLRPRSKA